MPVIALTTIIKALLLIAVQEIIRWLKLKSVNVFMILQCHYLLHDTNLYYLYFCLFVKLIEIMLVQCRSVKTAKPGHQRIKSDPQEDIAKNKIGGK